MPATTSVILNVRNLEKSVAFYQDLGFRTKLEWKGEDGAVAYVDLDYKGAELGLADIASNPDPDFRKWVAGPLGGGVLIGFTVPDVDAVYERARKAGAAIEMEITDRPYGRMFMMTDPEGYSVSFTTERKKRRRAPTRKVARTRGARAPPKRRR